ncbi:hypothetical protein [Actinomadura craniellae]|uniref:hypothetical protein n=1 Tax=Actinomadura craniellae TaxID=2231787 RepID=UPI0011BDE5C2|nr:hypothetical protein [Actinomadura craniellae]
MDPLLMTSGTALVAAMATDGWQGARAGAVKLWRRVYPDRAEAVEAELEEVRGEVLAARRDGDEDAEQELVADWRRRLARLVAADPAVGAEIQQVLDQVWKPLLPANEQPGTQNVSMNATAKDRGRVYMAGRDQTINEK